MHHRSAAAAWIELAPWIADEALAPSQNALLSGDVDGSFGAALTRIGDLNSGGPTNGFRG
ncbi:MAG: hypothetical protein EXS13_00155 [Planctomycetes bacterium]|nr:hypothetical protein [Planctomycetota bacterium]